MCGLVGLYSSNFLVKHKNCLQDLLYLDTFRGRDSTGVAAIRRNADTAILKSTVPGYEFVEGNRLDLHLKVDDFCWIGHNRFGTIGKNIKSNAHPFEILDEDGSCILVGAHNGTLKNKHMLKEHNAFGTDSEALYYNIAVDSIEEVIPKIEGAWALTYYDHIAEELRVLRNKERTLFYAWEDDEQTLIWASEMWMIRVACSRHGIKLLEDKVWAFAEDTLYRFPAPEKMRDKLTMERKGGLVGKGPAFFPQNGQRRNGVWTPAGGRTETNPSTTSSLEQKAQTTCKTATEQPAQTEAKVNATTKSGTQSSQDSQKQTNEKSSSSEKQSKDDNVRSILSAKTYKGFGNKKLTLQELERQLEKGCVWCETEEIKAKDKFAWIGNGLPICQKCIDGVHEPLVLGIELPSTSVH